MHIDSYWSASLSILWLFGVSWLVRMRLVFLIVPGQVKRRVNILVCIVCLEWSHHMQIVRGLSLCLDTLHLGVYQVINRVMDFNIAHFMY